MQTDLHSKLVHTNSHTSAPQALSLNYEISDLTPSLPYKNIEAYKKKM